MKKKKPNTPAEAIAVAATTISTSKDLKSLINEHSLFFDKLIELIPAKFYLPNDDADSKPWFKGLSKAAKASLKQQTRENIKLARRNRHDPEKVSQSSTLDLLKQSLTKTQQINPEKDGDNVSEDDEMDPAGLADNGNGNSKSVTYEELRQRLRRKIELLRGNRGGEKSVKKEKEINGDNHNKKSGEEKKRKRDTDDGDDEKGEGKVKVSAEGLVEKGIEFGKLKIGDEEKGNKKKKRKLPKAKELERVQRLEEMKRENPTIANKESWKAATSRAYGAKVHDDPKLLKESIKKEKRKRVKNAEKWKERVERTTKMKLDRQQKRTDNIAERAKDKKARKIAKREKKLMRPGFEGRKEGYITKN